MLPLDTPRHVRHKIRLEFKYRKTFINALAFPIVLRFPLKDGTQAYRASKREECEQMISKRSNLPTQSAMYF